MYSRLVYDGAPAAPSLLDIAEPDDRVIVCNSFSKTWMMTGWRLGWLVVPEGTRDAVTELVEVTHSGVAPFIQHAGVAAVPDTAAVERFLAHCARGRDADGRGVVRAQRRALRGAGRGVLCFHRRRGADRQHGAGEASWSSITASRWRRAWRSALPARDI